MSPIKGSCLMKISYGILHRVCFWTPTAPFKDVADKTCDVAAEESKSNDEVGEGLGDVDEGARREEYNASG